MRAKRYDASTSKQTEVELVFSTDALTVTADDGVKSYALGSVGFSDRLGNMPRSIYLPDGNVCETGDNDTIDALLKKLNRKKGARFLHYVESRLRYAFFALITTGVFTYAFVIFGLPAIATYVADNIPGPVVYRLGSGTLATLDNMLLQPSALSQTRRQELRTYFTSYARTMGEWPKINVVFRSGPLGPNALALPDGTIVFTDALVNLAEHDEELLGIFFHELGHVQRRHALRTVLQDSAFYLVVSAITGDATAAGSVLATLPTLLVENNYSQRMEIEADDYAFEKMQAHHIPHKHFANIMQRLLDETPINEDSTTLRYISSHPSTQSRIDKFNHADNVIPLR